MRFSRTAATWGDSPKSEPLDTDSSRGSAKRRRLKALGIIVLLSYFGYLWVAQSIQYRRIDQDIQSLEMTLSEIAEKREQLEAEKERKLTDSYIEERARKDLGLMRQGEIPFWRVQKNE